MAGYHIRVYEDDDYEMVRDVFKSGLEELASDLYRYILKLPRTKFLLFGLPLAVYLSFKSVLLSASAAAVILGFAWFGAKYVFSSYVQYNLKGDMADIQQHYMQKKGARFWVVECSGNVVGIVAAEPYPDPGGAAKVELKHMSVRKGYRGQGIGKALCRTVLIFAKQEGYESVHLGTSIVQDSGRRLYETMGFKMRCCFVEPSFIGQMFYFLVFSYQYDISECIW